MSYEYRVGGLSYGSTSSARTERNSSPIPSPYSLTSSLSSPSADDYSPTSTVVSVTPPRSPYPKTIILPSRDVPGPQTTSPGFHQDLLWPEMHLPMGHGLDPIDESWPFTTNDHRECDLNIGTFTHSAALGFHPDISFDMHTTDGSAFAEDLDGQRRHGHSGSYIMRPAASEGAADLYLAIDHENTRDGSVSCWADPPQPPLPKRRRFAVGGLYGLARRRSNESAPPTGIPRGKSDQKAWSRQADKHKRNWFQKLLRKIVGR